ncbi:hypothetical protein JW935_00795 [candidate division KSB1 bacterium]|nr:hypothetical protein [candidate division KSB1 bacterium]
MYDVEGSYSAAVDDLWGTGPNDLYTSGTITFNDNTNDDFRGFLLHYDGQKWYEILKGPSDSQFLRIRKDRQNIYLLSFSIGLANNSGETVTLYKVKKNKLEEISKVSRAQVFWATFNIIGGKTYFIIGKDIFIYSQDKLLKQFSFPDPDFYCDISGRNGVDVFLPTATGIAHYNGNDIKYIYSFPTDRMGNMNVPVVFEKDIFWCTRNPRGITGSYNLMLHGKLDEKRR